MSQRRVPRPQRAHCAVRPSWSRELSGLQAVSHRRGESSEPLEAGVELDCSLLNKRPVVRGHGRPFSGHHLSVPCCQFLLSLDLVVPRHVSDIPLDCVSKVTCLTVLHCQVVGPLPSLPPIWSLWPQLSPGSARFRGSALPSLSQSRPTSLMGAWFSGHTHVHTHVRTRRAFLEKPPPSTALPQVVVPGHGRARSICMAWFLHPR